ncbi:MAG: hypothetical protein FWD60_00805 [Candidatus Azobacteroides sp.]|nr:hypothetical protein [Candidatus Azobacteroides sp.]
MKQIIKKTCLLLFLISGIGLYTENGKFTFFASSYAYEDDIDWGCDGSIAGGVECDEIEIVGEKPEPKPELPPEPVLDPDPDPCENPCDCMDCDDDDSNDDEEEKDKKDPCVEKDKLDNNLKDNNTSHYTDLTAKLNDPNEWGTTLYAQFNSYIYNGTPTYFADPINTQGSINSYEAGYIENTAGQIASYGFIHTHPAGANNIDCLSAQDVYTMQVYVNQYFDAIERENPWDSKADFLNEYVTVIAVGQNATYAITVKDWDNLRDLLSQQTAEQRENNIIDKMQNNGYSGEAAFLSEFGSAVNLYISPKGNNLQFAPKNQIGNTTISKPCI